MKQFTPSALLALILLMMAGLCARADPIGFTYSFGLPDAITSGTGSVTFTGFANPAMSVDAGVLTPLLAAKVFTNSSATDNPDVFNSTFTVMLNLKDTLSQETVSMPFTGELVGSLTFDDGSGLTLTFTGDTTQSQTLGDYQYSAMIDPVMTTLPKPGSEVELLLSALVTVTAAPGGGTGGGDGGGPVIDPPDDNDPPTTNNAPEPASLLLGLVAGPLALLARRRRQSER